MRCHSARTWGSSSGQLRQTSSASPGEFSSSSTSASTRGSSTIAALVTIGWPEMIQFPLQKKNGTIQAALNGFCGDFQQFSRLGVHEPLDVNQAENLALFFGEMINRLKDAAAVRRQL